MPNARRFSKASGRRHPRHDLLRLALCTSRRRSTTSCIGRAISSVAEDASRRIFSLPMHAYIEDVEIDAVCNAVLSAL